MNYVSSSSANGSIGYVEYSYALAENYPVAKLLNAAGFYTLPTQYNVAVALQKAVINMDKNSPNYLLQNLDQVYVDTDPRTYPLSSYVYMIEPTGVYPKPETNITTSKRQAIANFEYYAICQGQREIGPIGYSPLPVNLVEASFGQIQKLKDADPGVSLQNLNILTCANPTFVLGHPSANYLAQIAPKPLACDAVGAGPCVASTAPTGGTGGSGGSSSAGTGTSAGGSGSGSGSSGTGTGSSGSTSQTGGATNAGIGDGTVQVLPVTLARPTTSLWSSALSWLAAVLLALVCVVPPAVALRRSRRKTP
jgi:uncharacterized membrane protein YgcG